MGRLDDLRKEAGGAAEVRQDGGHAPLAERSILGTVGPIDGAAARRAGGQVVRRRFGAPPATPVRTCHPRSRASCSCRRRWPAAARAGTRGSPAAASSASGVERRNAAVRRIGDQGRAPPRRLVRQEDVGGVGAADVLLAAALVTPDVLADDRRALLVQLGPFLVGEELLVGVASRPLQRDLEGVGPDALQIRRPPRRLRRGSGRLAGPCGRRRRLGLPHDREWSRLHEQRQGE